MEGARAVSQDDGNGWSVYQKLVLHRLDRVDAELAELAAQVVLLRIDGENRRARAIFAGSLAGAVAAVVTSVVGVLFT